MGGNQEKPLKRIKKKRVEADSGSDLFLLQSRIDEIDDRIRVIYRWVMFQRVVGWIKFAIFVIFILVGFRTYQDHAEEFNNAMQQFQRQYERGQEILNSIPENGFFPINFNDIQFNQK